MAPRNLSIKKKSKSWRRRSVPQKKKRNVWLNNERERRKRKKTTHGERACVPLDTPLIYPKCTGCCSRADRRF